MYTPGKSTFGILMEGSTGKYYKNIKILDADKTIIRNHSDKLIGRYDFVLPWVSPENFNYDIDFEYI